MSCTYFSKWFDIATAGLCDNAKARIREEVEEHYHSALESALQTVQDIDQASSIAVATLGDAEIANKEFRAKYLTIWEDRDLKNIKKHRTWRQRLIAFSWLILLAYIVVINFSQYSDFSKIDSLFDVCSHPFYWLAMLLFLGNTVFWPTLFGVLSPRTVVLVRAITVPVYTFLGVILAAWFVPEFRNFAIPIAVVCSSLFCISEFCTRARAVPKTGPQHRYVCVCVKQRQCVAQPFVSASLQFGV
ncbi:MAG: hypothetical protein SGI88_03430 [Candidatus Hydrogenedentes bacterium]|nr:hypothetical protein [Candidatus Hydrogenedentota bacterium]